MSDAFDKVMSIAMPMAAKAAKGDDDAGGEIIAVLASALGRTIARCADGNPHAIDRLLTGAENYIASEAAETTHMINSIKSIRAKAND